jgi:POT family proton-dependent oligopeptide transporter
MMLATVLILGAVVFYMLFNQAGSSINLFAARNIDLSITSTAAVYNVLGMDIPVGTRAQLAAAGIEPGGWWQWVDTGIASPQTQSFNAGFILIFAPIFAALWAFLGRRDADPNPVLKFGIGIIQLGLGFMVVVWGAGLADASFRMPIVMLGMLYLLHTTGELCISPVGLSQITRLALPAVVSFMMAVWFLSSSIAQYAGGWIAALAGTATVGGKVVNPELALHTTLGVFQTLGLAGLGLGAVFIAVSFAIKHWAHREAETTAPAVSKELPQGA